MKYFCVLLHIRLENVSGKGIDPNKIHTSFKLVLKNFIKLCFYIGEADGCCEFESSHLCYWV
jgi:hypothetical protein